MDPLSISASAASLAGAAAIIAAGLYDLVNNIKNVDTKISNLSHEVTRLTNLLKSVETVVQQCQPQVLTLAHLDDHMWQQINNALKDCKSNLEGLEALVLRLGGEPDPEAKNLVRLLKKPSRHFQFTVNKDDITDFTNKIYKSNCAMQTALSVVNVSLTFRANVSQESLFKELNDLKALVEESLKAAHRQGENPDPSAASQSENLESLAIAAHQFHTVASSTASSRYGGVERRPSFLNWGGSESGTLTDAQRERIERWNDLAIIEETGEDSMTEGTLPSSGYVDSLTTITSPDIDDAHSHTGKTQALGAVDEQENTDDESDFEFDFLKNFEELAYASFLAEDYPKAEQCLRRAVERSTGDASGNTDFRKLKTQLALCCCLQEKWDHAIGIITTLPQTKSMANLPLFHLLQAVTLAHLQGDRLEEAYATCKTVLKGKKKIFGRGSHDYNECLSILATICEKRGEPLEAEAVRHSIPRGWTPTSPRSPKQYILSHSNLVRVVFSKKTEQAHVPKTHVPEAEVNDQNLRSPESSKSVQVTPNASSSGHWTTLVRREPRDGLYRAEQDERKGMMIEETDTGKEFVVHNGPNVPRVTVDVVHGGGPAYSASSDPPAPRVPELEINYAVETMQPLSPPRRDHFTMVPRDALPLRPMSPKKHAPSWSADLTELRSSASQLDLSRTSISRNLSQRVASSQPPASQSMQGLSRGHSQRSMASSQQGTGLSRPTRFFQQNTEEDITNQTGQEMATGSSPTLESPTKVFCRPLSHQRLIDQVRQAQTGLPSKRRPIEDGLELASSPPGAPFIKQMVPSGGDEMYSTLEVVNTDERAIQNIKNDEKTSRSPQFLPSVQSTGKLKHVSHATDLQSLYQLRTRWTVQKDIGNIGGPRPFNSTGSPQFLPLKQAPVPEGYFLGLSVRSMTRDVVALVKGASEITVCKLPHIAKEGIAKAAVKRFFRKKGPSFAEGVPTYTVHLQSPRNWLEEFNVTEMTGDLYCLPEKDKGQDDRTWRIEAEIANLLRRDQTMPSSAAVTSLRIEGLVYAISDFVERTAWKDWTKGLGVWPLMQHAKVIPMSYAIMQYYLYHGALQLRPSQDPDAVVTVLHCDAVFVDCMAYGLQAVSSERVEIAEIQTTFMSELCGYMHAIDEFKKLASGQLLATIRQLRHIIDASAIDGILQLCLSRFYYKILPGFRNDGKEWIIEYDVPESVFGFRTGRLKFSDDEILQCLAPSVTMIVKMLRRTLEKVHDADEMISYLLLAGFYSRSKYLMKELEKVLDEVRGDNKDLRIQILCSPDEDHLTSLGALYHAIGS